jgi:CRP/FNR family transcriptional regulator
MPEKVLCLLGLRQNARYKTIMNSIPPNNSVNSRTGGPTIVAPTLWTLGGDSGRSLSAEAQALLAVIATVVRFRKGERIYGAGDRANAVFNIITGVVKSYRTLSDGRQHIVGFLFADDLIGLAENGTYVNSAEAVTAATLYRIPTAPLEARLRNHADLDFQVISKLCHELREAQRHAFVLSKRHAIAKMGLFLQMLETNHAGRRESMGEVYLQMTRQDIGAYVGISPEAVTRSLRQLVSRGAIAFRDRRHVQIADRSRLEAAISEIRTPQ